MVAKAVRWMWAVMLLGGFLVPSIPMDRVGFPLDFAKHGIIKAQDGGASTNGVVWCKECK